MQTSNGTSDFNQTPGTGTTASGASPVELQAKIDTLRGLQSRGRLQAILTAVLGVGMFGVFTASTYTALQNNFTDTAVTAALQRHAPTLAQPVSTEMKRTLTAVAPTYRKLIAERFPETRKQVAERVMLRLYEIPEQTGNQLLARLQTSFDRVLVRIQPELAAAFPALSDEQRREVLAGYFKTAIAKRNADLGDYVHNLYATELTRTKTVLEKFNLALDPSTTPNEALQRQLSKTIMLLVDETIAEYADGNGGDLSFADTGGASDILEQLLSGKLTLTTPLTGEPVGPTRDATASTIDLGGDK